MKLVRGQVEVGLPNPQICLHQLAEVERGTWVAMLREGREGMAESRL